MSEHQHHEGCAHHHPHPPAAGRALHRDWRIWAAVVIMLVAMAIYLFTMGDVGEPPLPATNTPAATAPVSPQ